MRGLTQTARRAVGRSWALPFLGAALARYCRCIYPRHLLHSRGGCGSAGAAAAAASLPRRRSEVVGSLASTCTVMTSLLRITYCKTGVAGKLASVEMA